MNLILGEGSVVVQVRLARSRPTWGCGLALLHGAISAESIARVRVDIVWCLGWFTCRASGIRHLIVPLCFVTGGRVLADAFKDASATQRV